MNTNVTIGRKLGWGVTAMGSFLLVLSFISLRAINQLGDSLDAAVNRTAKKLELIGTTQAAFLDLKNESLRQQFAYAILEMEKRPGDKPGGAAAKDCSACHVPATVEESIRSLEATGGLVRNGTTQLAGLVTDGGARQAVATIENGASKWLSHSRRYLTLAGGKQFPEAHAVLQEKMLPIVAEVEAASKVLADREREALSVSNRAARATISSNRWIASALIGLNLLVVAAVLLLVRKVTGTFREAVAEMKVESTQVAVAAGEVAAASQVLAQGASEQAASLEETSASSQEIDAMARRNGENSSAAVELMGQSQEMFHEVNNSLVQMVQAMNEIKSQSDKISKIIRVIDEIAFQTNILALNAAVEAARAGDAGMGFAVVADEVRSLAQRSAQAAKDTAELIEESIAKSDAGRARVSRVTSAIRGITGCADKVKALVDEVNLGSQEQSRGIAQIGSALGQMDQVTQRNAASAEENAATAEELNARSKALRCLVNRLDSMVGTAPQWGTPGIQVAGSSCAKPARTA